MTDKKWFEFYDYIVLHEDEIREALLEGRIKKYHKEKHREYWEELEGKKKKDGHVTNL